MWFIDLTVATWRIQIHFSEFMSFLFHEKTEKTQEYFAWYENGGRRLLGAQSINTERASSNVLPPQTGSYKLNNDN